MLFKWRPHTYSWICHDVGARVFRSCPSEDGYVVQVVVQVTVQVTTGSAEA
jgi:hypothetical protein